MKLKYKIILLFIICFFMLSTHSIAGQFKVTKVYDGDTIMAEGYDIVIYVLLAGIDAPEIGTQKHKPGQAYGQEAKRYLENLILHKIVDIKGYGIGPYPCNHLIGEIYLKDKNINIEMINKGLAEVCSEKPPDGLNIVPYFEAEREAKKAEQGMWSRGKEYISPRDWREMHRNK